MQRTKTHTFKISESQKQTLIILAEKYKINVSSFIRSSINEKLQREKETIFENYKEVQTYLKELNNLPF